MGGGCGGRAPRRRHSACLSDSHRSDLRSRRARRASPAIGVYRFWRDMGYVAGGLVAGVAADAISFAGAIALVAVLTALSGSWVWFDFPRDSGHS